MQFSSRISQIKPSATVALNAKALALSKKGIDVLNFTVGEPDFPTPKIIVDRGVQSLQAGRTKYGAAGGGLELRTAVCDKLKRENHLTFAPEQVVVGIGAKEILFHTFLSLLNEGDEVLLPIPYWVSYADQIKAAGAHAVEIPLSDIHHPDLTVEQIKRFETSRTRAIVLNSPNNPAGFIYSEKTLRSIGQYLATKNWWIISDEIYEYMAFDTPHISMLELCPDLKDRFVYINGLSKSFAMTGWRVGYLAGPVPVAQMVRSLQSHSSTCLPGFIEDASVAALNSGKELMKTEVASLHQRRDIAASLLRAAQIDFIPAQGAFYVFLDVKKYLKKFSSTIELCNELLEKYHVAIVPGEAFGAPGFVRISYATSEEKLRRGLDIVVKALSDQ